MARHAIDHALAATVEAPEVPGGRRMPVEDPYADAKSMLVCSVSRANRCRSVHIVDLAPVAILGFESDLVAVELLFTSLLVQANRALLTAGRDDRRARQRGFRSSFLSAYAVRIGQRLEACTSDQVSAVDADEGGRLLPVLAARDDAVEDAVEAMFGDSGPRRRPRSWPATRWPHSRTQPPQRGRRPRGSGHPHLPADEIVVLTSDPTDMVSAAASRKVTVNRI